jgi:hypothetical protein
VCRVVRRLLNQNNKRIQHSMTTVQYTEPMSNNWKHNKHALNSFMATPKGHKETNSLGTLVGGESLQ